MLDWSDMNYHDDSMYQQVASIEIYVEEKKKKGKKH